MILDSFIVDTLGGTISDPDINAMCTCPACGKDGHFGIRRDSGLGNCFRCGYKVNLAKLLRDLTGVSPYMAYTQAVKLVKDGTKRKVQDNDDWEIAVVSALFKEESVMPPQKFFPPECVVDIMHPKAYVARRYLRNRGFRKAHFGQYELWYGVDPKKPEERRLEGHIVFPICEIGGTLQSWTTRAVTGNMTPKSFHAAGIKKQWVYGLDRTVVRPSVFVVEGPLDVLALPRVSVALLGKVVNNDQATLLTTNFQRAYICLDKDAYKESLRVGKFLYRRGMDVEICRLDKGDPADHITKNPNDLISQLMDTSERFDLTMHDERMASICGSI